MGRGCPAQHVVISRQDQERMETLVRQRTAPYTRVDAEEVQKSLRDRLGHEQVQVKPHGKNLLLQIEDAGEMDTIARLTRMASCKRVRMETNEFG